MENVVLVDRDDHEIGVMEKMEAHEKGLLHRAFSVFLINDKGEIYFNKEPSINIILAVYGQILVVAILGQVNLWKQQPKEDWKKRWELSVNLGHFLALFIEKIFQMD